MVGLNEGPFKITPHKYKVGMMQGSKFKRITNADKIPLNNFGFVSFASILESTVEDKTVGNVLMSFPFISDPINHFVSL